MYNILANAAPLGLEFMKGTWLIVTIILMIIGLIIIGYFYDDDDGPLVILEGLGVVGACLFWPIILAGAILIGVLALPILLGIRFKKMKEKRKEKKKEKQEFLNKIDKFKTEKL